MQEKYFDPNNSSTVYLLFSCTLYMYNDMKFHKTFINQILNDIRIPITLHFFKGNRHKFEVIGDLI